MTQHNPEHSPEKQRENVPSEKPGEHDQRRDERRTPGTPQEEHPGKPGESGDSDSELLRVPSLDPLAGGRFAPDAGAPETRTPRHVGSHEWRDTHEARNREAVEAARESDDLREQRGQIPNEEKRKRDEAQARDKAKREHGGKEGGDKDLDNIAESIAQSDADARAEDDGSIPPGAGSWPIPNDPAVIDPLGHLDDLPGVTETPPVPGAGLPEEAPTPPPPPALPEDFKGKRADVPSPVPSHAPERAPREGASEQHPPDRPQDRMDAGSGHGPTPAPTKKGM